MTEEDKLYAIALTKLGYISPESLLRLVCEAGGAKEVHANRNSIADVLPGCTPRLVELLSGDWSDALRLAEAEIAYCADNGIGILGYADGFYPARLTNCPDAPVILYYKGLADLNQRHVINIVGTRHCTAYGADIIRRFVAELHSLCPNVLIVSGLAYGVDVNAHVQALDNGFETVGVLAHGLDTLYPAVHKAVASRMIGRGGLLTEFTSGTKIDKVNFIQRNRIVAGMSDACIIVESASRGGGLITVRIAQDYGRDTFAFPGRVGDKYSEGCNALIRSNGAMLLSSASDFVETMGWQTDQLLAKAKSRGIERELFPELTPQQHTVADALRSHGDLQLNTLLAITGLPIGILNQTLFELEMMGLVTPYAGATYHLIT